MVVDLDHRLFLQQEYAIINPLQVGKEQYADLAVQRLVPEGLERHERMLPLLVHLGGMRTEQRIELLERSDLWERQRHMPLFSALFSSEHGLERVRTGLLSRMLLRCDDGRRAWLRYHDPRVFRHLHWLLEKEQLAALMGSAQTWLGFDPLSRCWCQWSRPEARGHPYLRLDANQWQAVEQFEALNRCLRDLAGEGGAVGDDAARLLLDGLLVARKQGLIRSEDAVLFARQELEHGPGIASFPAVALRLRHARERQTSYVIACDSLLADDFLRREASRDPRTRIDEHECD